MSDRIRQLLPAAWIVVLLVSGCENTPPAPPAATATPRVTLTPYVPAVPDSTRTPTPRPVFSATPPPTPTATPFLYSIVEGDTLIGIAFRYGLTLADLLAANPEVDPQFLTIGDELIIPLPESPAAGAAAPTPVGDVAPLGGLVCRPDAAGGLWCFQIYENLGEGAVEGLSAQVSLYDGEGGLIGTRTALTPVNVIPPGAAAPAAAWFPGAEGMVQSSVMILSALPVQPADPRYVPITASFESDIEGRSAAVSIMAAPADDDDGPAAARLRAAVLAFDSDGEILGIRVLESSVAGSAPPWIVNGNVYSLGGTIDSIEVLVEAYP